MSVQPQDVHALLCEELYLFADRQSDVRYFDVFVARRAHADEGRIPASQRKNVGCHILVVENDIGCFDDASNTVRDVIGVIGVDYDLQGLAGWHGCAAALRDKGAQFMCEVIGRDFSGVVRAQRVLEKSGPEALS